MSNNQKAVKNNPSDSKNVIRVALLRTGIKVFIKSQKKSFQGKRIGIGLIIPVF